MDVDRPAPDDKHPAQLRAADHPAAPLAVLDPTWPGPLRADADRLVTVSWE